LILLWTLSLALAQSPWDSPDAPEPEAPAEPAPAPQDASPDSPWGSSESESAEPEQTEPVVEPEEPEPEAEPEVMAEPEPEPEPEPEVMAEAAEPAPEEPTRKAHYKQHHDYDHASLFGPYDVYGDRSPGLTPSGYRIKAFDAGTGAAVRNSWVIGPEGGVFVARFEGTINILRKGAIHVALPLASYPAPDGRTPGLGNLEVSGYGWWQRGKWTIALGGRAAIPVSSPTYTWAHSGPEVWPAAGASAATELRYVNKVTTMIRVAAGLYYFTDGAPFEGLKPHIEAAVGVDAPFAKILGAQAELAGAFWDPSPLDFAAYFRVDPVEGLRFRVGGLMPIGTWAGLSPADDTAGVDEGTVTLDVQVAL